MFLSRSLVIAAALFVGASAHAEFKPAVTADLMGGYAATQGGKGAGLLTGGLNFVPAWRQGRVTLLPAITLNSGGQERSIEEGTIFVRSATFNARPRVLFDTAGGLRWGVSGQALRTWNIETLNESFGTGLYDYEQFGGGLEFEFPLPSLSGRLTGGVDLSHRGYPNNRNFASSAALSGGKNYYFKDFNAVAPTLTLNLEEAGLSFSYLLELRSYTDSLVVKPSGELDVSKLRQDQLHTLSLQGQRALSQTLNLAATVDLRLNASNQSYFDRLAGVPTYTPNSEDYISEGLRLELPWRADRLWKGLVLAPGLSAEMVHTNKFVQNQAGAYLADKIQQQNYSTSLRMEKALPWGLVWVSQAQLQIARSNQVLQRGVLNSYEYWQVATGLSFRFPGASPPQEEQRRYGISLKAVPKTAAAEVRSVLMRRLGLGEAEVEKLVQTLPALVAEGLDIQAANALFVDLHVAGAKVELR